MQISQKFWIVERKQCTITIRNAAMSPGDEDLYLQHMLNAAQ